MNLATTIIDTVIGTNWTSHLPSEGGTRALVTTCNSDYAPHSGKTFLLDAATGNVIWECESVSARSAGNQVVAVLTDANGTSQTFPFNESGRLGSDYHAVKHRQVAARQRGQYWEMLPQAEVAIRSEPTNLALATELLATLEGREDQNPVRAQAELLRLRGEIAEAAGDVGATRILWEQALALDSQVGIKRRLAGLGPEPTGRGEQAK